MIKPHTNQSGTVHQVYGRARVEGRSVKVYVGSYATRREAERADEDHRARQRLISDGELPAACGGNIRAIVAVLVDTGMRLDEALHLHWSDVDLKTRLIHVQRGRRGPTKGNRARHVPIGASILGLLRDMKLAAGKSQL